jgi:putative phosphoribosyl transferase
MAGGDRAGGAGQSEPGRAPVEREAIRIAVGGAMLEGDLDRLPASSGIVLFAHGSGSSRRSPRTARSPTTSSGPASAPC